MPSSTPTPLCPIYGAPNFTGRTPLYHWLLKIAVESRYYPYLFPSLTFFFLCAYYDVSYRLLLLWHPLAHIRDIFQSSQVSVVPFSIAAKALKTWGGPFSRPQSPLASTEFLVYGSKSVFFLPPLRLLQPPLLSMLTKMSHQSNKKHSILSTHL